MEDAKDCPVWFSEPSQADNSWGRRGESVTSWVGRSTLPRARAPRRFLNENLSVLPKEHQAALYRALHDPLDPLAVLEPPGGVDDERDPEALFVGVVFVDVAAVLAEALPMVAEDYEDRVLVEPQLLVLLDEVERNGRARAPKSTARPADPFLPTPTRNRTR